MSPPAPPCAGVALSSLVNIVSNALSSSIAKFLLLDLYFLPAPTGIWPLSIASRGTKPLRVWEFSSYLCYLARFASFSFFFFCSTIFRDFWFSFGLNMCSIS